MIRNSTFLVIFVLQQTWRNVILISHKTLRELKRRLCDAYALMQGCWNDCALRTV